MHITKMLTSVTLKVCITERCINLNTTKFAKTGDVCRWMHGFELHLQLRCELLYCRKM